MGNNIKGNGGVGLELTCNSGISLELLVSERAEGRVIYSTNSEFSVHLVKFWVSISHIIIVP